MTEVGITGSGTKYHKVNSDGGAECGADIDRVKSMEEIRDMGLRMAREMLPCGQCWGESSEEEQSHGSEDILDDVLR